MLGYCAIGRVKAATPPISTMTIASTLASTGRSMKNLEIMAGLGSLRRRSRDGGELGRDLASRDRPAIGRDHDAVVGLESGVDHPQAADQQGAQRDSLLLDHVVLVDDQQVAAGLV